MPNVNKFFGCGHLGKDPEVRFAQSGTAVASFSVGITGSEKKDGEWVKVTEWVACTAFGKQAEWLQEASKGDLCIFSGRLKTEKYEKDGQTRYITKIVCDDVQTQKKGEKPVSNIADTDIDAPSKGRAIDPMEDDIPFMRLGKIY